MGLSNMTGQEWSCGAKGGVSLGLKPQGSIHCRSVPATRWRMVDDGLVHDLAKTSFGLSQDRDRLPGEAKDEGSGAQTNFSTLQWRM
jgi:hypothetical protein